MGWTIPLILFWGLELWHSFSQLSQKLLQNTVNWPRSEPITELAVHNTLKTSTNHKRTHGFFLITWIYNLCLLSCRKHIHQLQEQILWGNIPFNNKMEQNRTKQKTIHSSWPWESYVFFFFFFFLYTIKRSLMVVNAQSWIRHNTLWLPPTSNDQCTDIQHLNRHNFTLCRLIQEGVRRHTDSALGVIFTQLYHWLDEWMV